MNTKLSIIIPCYNSENTLEEAIKSVLRQEFQDWEAIIVNDGSSDSTEEIALCWLQKDNRIKYYSKQNEGLCKTRNFGISISNGDYILPLDSDNVLLDDFTKAAVKVLDENQEIGVIHGHAEFIGEKSGLWEVDDFKLEKILLGNYIDACAMYRKKIWEQVGGYDESLPCKGLEDWELWIAFGAIDVQFFHLKKVTFKYRVSKGSMIDSFTKEMANTTREYVAKKYSTLYCFYYHKIARENSKLSNSLKSRKFVINTFCELFFGFSFFKQKLKQL